MRSRINRQVASFLLLFLWHAVTGVQTAMARSSQLLAAPVVLTHVTCSGECPVVPAGPTGVRLPDTFCGIQQRLHCDVRLEPAELKLPADGGTRFAPCPSYWPRTSPAEHTPHMRQHQRQSPWATASRPDYQNDSSAGVGSGSPLLPGRYTCQIPGQS